MVGVAGLFGDTHVVADEDCGVGLGVVECEHAFEWEPVALGDGPP